MQEVYFLFCFVLFVNSLPRRDRTKNTKQAELREEKNLDKAEDIDRERETKTEEWMELEPKSEDEGC